MPSDSRPMRTCIGCRATTDMSELVRCVAVVDADTRSVVFDEKRTLPGRGAWLHPDPSCLDRAVRAKAFNRAFKAQVTVDPDLIAATRERWEVRTVDAAHPDTGE